MKIRAIILKQLWRRIFGQIGQREFQPVILITGCGSGIGWALAKKLYSLSQYRVVVTARRGSIKTLRDRFPENERFKIIELDVTSEIQRADLVARIDQTWGGVDILVNNAGISYRAVIEHMTEKDESVQMRTNYFGPMGLIRLVLPSMRLKGRGKIICVSSVSGMLSMPTMASYSASKHAIEGACEALWYEMKPLGLNVTLVQPGFVRSESFRRVYFTEHSNPGVCVQGPYADIYQNMGPFIERMMAMSFSTPEAIAKKIIRVIQKENPPLWVPATYDALLFYYLRRLLPRRWLLPFLFLCLPRSRQWGKTYSQRKKSRSF